MNRCQLSQLTRLNAWELCLRLKRYSTVCFPMLWKIKFGMFARVIERTNEWGVGWMCVFVHFICLLIATSNFEWLNVKRLMAYLYSSITERNGKCRQTCLWSKQSAWYNAQCLYGHFIHSKIVCVFMCRFLSFSVPVWAWLLRRWLLN